MSARRGPRGERGFVLPTRLMVFSVSVVALAGLVFIATQGDDEPERATPASSSSQPTTGATDTPDLGTPTSTPKPPPVVRKGKVNVVVFNNTNTKGLAGKTATRASKAGWNVLTTDNWVGTVDASTVYFPSAKLKPAAQLLAEDLGIKRVKKGFAPMKPGQLTVILTTDYR